MEDGDDKDAFEAELVAAAETVIADYDATFAAQRAEFILGSISFIDENWSDAAAFFNDSAAHNRDSYLAPIALMRAASALENAESYAEALAVYEDVYASYDKIFPDVPRAMLSVGRLKEQTGDAAGAVESYNELLDKYPGSGWASFARTRLIKIGE